MRATTDLSATFDQALSEEQSPAPDETTGAAETTQTEQAPEVTEQAQSTTPAEGAEPAAAAAETATADAQTAATQEPTFHDGVTAEKFDPQTLPAELKPAYTQMQGHFTRAMQGVKPYKDALDARQETFAPLFEGTELAEGGPAAQAEYLMDFSYQLLTDKDVQVQTYLKLQEKLEEYGLFDDAAAGGKDPAAQAAEGNQTAEQAEAAGADPELVNRLRAVEEWQRQELATRQQQEQLAAITAEENEHLERLKTAYRELEASPEFKSFDEDDWARVRADAFQAAGQDPNAVDFYQSAKQWKTFTDSKLQKVLAAQTSVTPTSAGAGAAGLASSAEEAPSTLEEASQRARARMGVK